MSSNGGIVLHVNIFYMIREMFRGIDWIFFFPYHHVGEGHFMCLCLLFSFPILSLFKPILLLLFTRSIRLGRTSFLLVLVSRRLVGRIGLLLFRRSLIRVVLVPPLIVIWRTMMDNIGPIGRCRRFVEFNVGDMGGKRFM